MINQQLFLHYKWIGLAEVSIFGEWACKDQGFLIGTCTPLILNPIKGRSVISARAHWLQISKFVAFIHHKNVPSQLHSVASIT